MTKIIKFLLIIIFFLPENLYPTEVKDLLNEGGKIVFIRHALAPGTGDPENFNLNDCSTQRNLSKEGVNQSKRIGLFFKKNNIKIHKVLSSEWCRCKDTAANAFQKYETLSALNSFYDEKFAINEKKQINELKKYIQNWNSRKNLIFITHYVVISSILDIGVSSGEMIVVDKNLNYLGSVLLK